MEIIVSTYERHNNVWSCICQDRFKSKKKAIAFIESKKRQANCELKDIAFELQTFGKDGMTFWIE